MSPTKNHDMGYSSLTEKDAAASKEKQSQFVLSTCLVTLILSVVMFYMACHVKLYPMEVEMLQIRHEINELKRDIGAKNSWDDGQDEDERDLMGEVEMIVQDQLHMDPEVDLGDPEWNAAADETLPRYRRSDDSERKEKERETGRKRKRQKDHHKKKRGTDDTKEKRVEEKTTTKEKKGRRKKRRSKIEELEVAQFVPKKYNTGDQTDCGVVTHYGLQVSCKEPAFWRMDLNTSNPDLVYFINGVAVIKKEGLYYIYGQVTFHDTRKSWSYKINRHTDSHTDTLMEYQAIREATRSRTDASRVYPTQMQGHINRVARLHKDDQLSLDLGYTNDTDPKRIVKLKPYMTFWGIVYIP